LIFGQKPAKILDLILKRTGNDLHGRYFGGCEHTDDRGTTMKRNKIALAVAGLTLVAVTGCSSSSKQAVSKDTTTTLSESQTSVVKLLASSHMMQDCLDGIGAMTSDQYQRCRGTATDKPSTTATAAVSPYEALIARPHTYEECATLSAGAKDAAQIQTCTAAANNLPTEVTPGMYVLEVTGKGSASVTYSDGTNTGQQDVKLPWSKQVPDSGELVQVLAQQQGTGEITCRIVSPTGVEMTKETSSGAYVIAHCTAQ
jgi:hypothetical protein